MSLVKEIMGSSVLDRSSSVTLKNHFNQRNSANPVLIPLEKRRIQVRKVVRTTPVAAISDNFFRFVPEEAVKFKVRAVVTVRNKNKEDFKETIVKQLDAFTDKIGRNVVLQLISTEIDPKTKTPKKSKEAVLKDWSQKSYVKAEMVNYTTDFMVDLNFGVPGAITVSNKHQKELLLENIMLEGFACGPVHFPCNSWVQSKKDHPSKRIFFFNTPWVGILLDTVITLGVSYMEFTDIIGAANFLYSLGMLLEFASFVWLRRKFTASRIEFR